MISLRVLAAVGIVALSSACRTTSESETKAAGDVVAAPPQPGAVNMPQTHCDTADNGGFFGLSAVDFSVVNNTMTLHDPDNDTTSTGPLNPAFRPAPGNAGSIEFTDFDGLVQESGATEVIVSKPLLETGAGKLTLRFRGEGFTTGNFTCSRTGGPVATTPPATPTPAPTPPPVNRHCLTADNGGFFGVSTVEFGIIGDTMTLRDVDNDNTATGPRNPNFRPTPANAGSAEFTDFDGLVQESGAMEVLASKPLLETGSGKLTLRFRGEVFTSGIFDCAPIAAAGG